MAAIDNTKKSARLLASRRYTHDTYTDAQEAFTSTLDINANEVYIDQSLIPSASLPFSGSGQNGNTYTVDGLSVVKYYYRAKMTKSDLNNEAWFLLSETTASSGVGAQLIDGNQLTNFISPKYSVSALTNANTEDATPGYGVKVFVSSNSTTPLQTWQRRLAKLGTGLAGGEGTSRSTRDACCADTTTEVCGSSGCCCWGNGMEVDWAEGGGETLRRLGGCAA